jgi:hypothetical protein
VVERHVCAGEWSRSHAAIALKAAALSTCGKVAGLDVRSGYIQRSSAALTRATRLHWTSSEARKCSLYVGCAARDGWASAPKSDSSFAADPKSKLAAPFPARD